MGREILRLFRVILVCATVLAALYWWQTRRLPFVPDPKAQTVAEKMADKIQRGDEASERCKLAEAVEAGTSENDMLLIFRAIEHEQKAHGKSACDIFNNYILLRAPSQGGGSAIRDASFVLDWKTYFGKPKEKAGMATKVRERMLKGDVSFVATEKIPADTLAKMNAVKNCVVRIDRVWPTNTAGTDKKALDSEMSPTLRVTTPSGTTFYCPK